MQSIWIVKSNSGKILTREKKIREDLQALLLFIVDLCSSEPETPVHWTAFGLNPQFKLHFPSIRILSLDQQN